MVPVNTNYRYGPGELSYLWQDCDARAVVFAGSFTPTIERPRASVPAPAGPRRRRCPAGRAGLPRRDLLATIERYRVCSVGWVGDAFARPVLA